MPEQLAKMPQNLSPPVRTGAGDISERELSRERYSLNSTPIGRVQPAHPKKVLYSVPVSKFTAKGQAPSPNLVRIKSCLEEYRCKGRAPKVHVAHKAASMEDLTPTKRVLKGRMAGRGVSSRKEADSALAVVRSPGAHSSVEEQAAARIGRFMLLSAWRQRRQELRCLRKTLEFQVTSSERLRAQVWALKSLLDSDNSKVRLAMRELDRLKQLLHDKDREKAVLEKEQRALEADISAAEDKASELSIGLRNCRNELDAALSAGEECARALERQQRATEEASVQRDQALDELSRLEVELRRREALMASAELKLCALQKDSENNQATIDWAMRKLKMEHDARVRAERACVRVGARAAKLRAAEVTLKACVRDARRRLSEVQRRWLPHPLLSMLESAKTMLIRHSSFHDVFIWSLLPARHGC